MLLDAQGNPLSQKQVQEEKLRHLVAQTEDAYQFNEENLSQEMPNYWQLLVTASQEVTKKFGMTEFDRRMFVLQRPQAYSAGNQFDLDINQMNRMMKVPMPDNVTCPTLERLKQLKVILQKELNELDEIIEKADLLESGSFPPEKTTEVQLEIIVMTLDLCGDLSVFCASESQRIGIPLGSIQMIIMNSNFTKLGEDGEPIWIDGKFQKGPNFKKPEPAITEFVKVFHQNRETINEGIRNNTIRPLRYG